MRPSLSRLPQSLSLAVFRLHIENGITVAIGIALVGAAFYGAFGLADAVAAATGALILSIVDRPEPVARKPMTMARGMIPACLVTFFTLLAAPFPLALIALTGIVGLCAGLLSAYGKPGLSLGGATILPLAFAMSAPIEGLAQIAAHMLFFAAGAVIYAGYAMNVARLLDDRVRRLLLGEATRSFVRYLRAKADLYDPRADGPVAFRALIEAHSALAERLQNARDAIFARRKTAQQLRRVDALIALLDATELFISSDADIETLRGSVHHHLMLRLRSLSDALAEDVEGVTHRLKDINAAHNLHPHEKQEENISAEIARLELAAAGNEEELQVLGAFRSTFNKIRRAEAAIVRLAATLDEATPVSEAAAKLDLTAFTQSPASGLSVLTSQFNMNAPALRYAIRLSLAMTIGLSLTMWFGNFHHGSWVVVTTALIMRANYSLTSQRRWDRVTGTLIGCVVAAVVGHFVPSEWTVPFIIVSIGISHAYALVDYRVTAVFATVTALLLLHLTEPQSVSLFLERMIDTLLGAGLSYLFSFLLPNWERKNLPQAVVRLLKNDAAYAREALTRVPVDQQYRLARKRALDAVTALSDTVRRVADEPNTDKAQLVRLYDLLAANYLLVSDLASVHVITLARAAELEPEKADAILAEARETVERMLKGEAPSADNDSRLRRRGFSALQSANGLTVLRRRLIHVERIAMRVGRLAKAAG